VTPAPRLWSRMIGATFLIAAGDVDLSVRAVAAFHPRFA
jgi:ribose/xylose/arabinose/galactoside ABC-type transport system permease subunit